MHRPTARRRTARKAALTAALALTTAMGSYEASDAAFSYHGSDYSVDEASRTRLRVCDRESDSNKVKGGWANVVDGGEDGSVTDGDGANSQCATTGPGSGPLIRKHHTCEKNWLSWDCGNWRTT